MLYLCISARPTTVPKASQRQLPNACPSDDAPSFLRDFLPLALPTLRRGHDRDAEIYGCGIIPMFLLRFFVALSSRAVRGCAPARRCIRVLTPCGPASASPSAHTPAVTCTALNDRPPAFPIRHCSPTSRLGSQLAFKSHSAPRPPQKSAPRRFRSRLATTRDQSLS